LESLGQLAGGVAHDFNNLLSVILNYSAFVVESVADEAVRDDIAEIRSAAERAARLTRQLLIFGRRETVHPVPLDLNAVVADVQTLLSRTIGEDIVLAMSPAAERPVVLADCGQLEQILVNLAVNARDAMPDGGTLTLETGVVSFDAHTASLHPGLQPGRFVQLSVSDSGSGMSAETIDRAFEPFFTTKLRGEGTGLGLATVYGIVTRAGGAVTIYSKLGVGTTIRVHLPLSDADPGHEAVAPLELRLGEGEVVLLVEDEAAIRKVATRILERNSYRVLQAADGQDALALAVEHVPDLVLTDVVMPKMSGPELAQHLETLLPGVPVLFMSGYSQGMLGPQRGLDDDVRLVQKPFSERTLIEGVHDALGTRGRPEQGPVEVGP
jgi:CheY-like chemotaxis protein